MRYEKLTEAPQRIEPTDFDLDDPAVNHAFAAEQLAKRMETIEQTADSIIFRTGDGERGWIMLYNNADQSADYVVQYRTRNWNWMNKSVTQCVLWRNAASPYVGGLTERIFFGHLLSTYQTIMSDYRQTPSGHDFWIARMKQAISRGHGVGVANTNHHTVAWFDPAAGRTFLAWLRQQDAYGPTAKYQSLRYVISA
jgi:hypothetical protein